LRESKFRHNVRRKAHASRSVLDRRPPQRFPKALREVQSSVFSAPAQLGIKRMPRSLASPCSPAISPAALDRRMRTTHEGGVNYSPGIPEYFSSPLRTKSWRAGSSGIPEIRLAGSARQAFSYKPRARAHFHRRSAIRAQAIERVDDCRHRIFNRKFSQTFVGVQDFDPIPTRHSPFSHSGRLFRSKRIQYALVGATAFLRVRVPPNVTVPCRHQPSSSTCSKGLRLRQRVSSENISAFLFQRSV